MFMSLFRNLKHKIPVEFNHILFLRVCWRVTLFYNFIILQIIWQFFTFVWSRWDFPFYIKILTRIFLVRYKKENWAKLSGKIVKPMTFSMLAVFIMVSWVVWARNTFVRLWEYPQVQYCWYQLHKLVFKVCFLECWSWAKKLRSSHRHFVYNRIQPIRNRCSLLHYNIRYITIPPQHQRLKLV